MSLIKSIILICFSFLSNKMLLFSQEKDIDLFGNMKHPVIGYLPCISNINLSPDLVEKTNIAFHMGAAEGGSSGYGYINKYQMKNYLEDIKNNYTPKQLRERYFYAQIGVQYLSQIELLDYKYTSVIDTIISLNQSQPSVRSYKLARMALSFKLIEVATSKIILSKYFNVLGTSLEPDKYNLSDSARAIKNMNNAIYQAAANYIRQNISIISEVLGVYEFKGEKAESLILDQFGTPYSSNFGSVYKIYCIDSIYQNKGLNFYDLEHIGFVEKEKSFNHKISNFEVKRGKKEVLEKWTNHKSLFCCKSNPPLTRSLPSDFKHTLIIDKVLGTDQSTPYLLKALKATTYEALALKPLLIDLLERDAYDIIEKERAIQNNAHSNATQGGITIGAKSYLNVYIKDQIKTSRIIEKIDESKALILNQSKDTSKSKDNKLTSKPKIVIGGGFPDKIESLFTLKLNIELIDIATGKITFAKGIDITGNNIIPYTKDSTLIMTSQNNAEDNTLKSISTEIWKLLFPIITPNIQVLNVLYNKRNEIDKVIITGGNNSGLLEGMKIDLFTKEFEVFNNEKLEKNILIGQLKISELRDNVSYCRFYPNNATKINIDLMSNNTFGKLIKF